MVVAPRAPATRSASDTVLMCLSFCAVFFFLSYGTHRGQLGMNELEGGFALVSLKNKLDNFVGGRIQS
jgi:hypothetical protein